MSLRLMIQPAVASFLAVRAGLSDARDGRPAFFWAALTNPAYRPELLHQGWKDVAKVFILASVLDVGYQLMVHRGVYLGELLIIATMLAIVPYVCIRGPVNRVARRKSISNPVARRMKTH
jgi:hypothetical protein